MFRPEVLGGKFLIINIPSAFLRCGLFFLLWGQALWFTFFGLNFRVLGLAWDSIMGFEILALHSTTLRLACLACLGHLKFLRRGKCAIPLPISKSWEQTPPSLGNRTASLSDSSPPAADCIIPDDSLSHRSALVCKSCRIVAPEFFDSSYCSGSRAGNGP